MIERYSTILADQLRRLPQTRPTMLQLANQFASRGNFPKQTKLGQNLSDDLISSLRSIFSPGPVKVTGDNTVKLELKTFFSSHNIQPDHWGKALLKTLNIEPETSTPHTHEAFNSLTARLCLQFPNLAHAINAALTSPTLVRQYLKTPETTTNFLTTLCKTAHNLLTTESPTRLSNLGAQFFNDSKALRRSTQGYNLLGDLIRNALNRDAFDREKAFEICGVTDNLSAIKVTLFGPFIYTAGNNRYEWIRQLWQAGQPATLSLFNLQNLTDITLEPISDYVITCENETPFCDLITQSPKTPVIYTGGYPNLAVTSLIRHLDPNITTIRHWGDTDLDGLIIASIINTIRPVTLWRCDLNTTTHSKSLRPLPRDKRQRAQRFISENPHFPFTDELLFTIQNGWLEQEAWRLQAPYPNQTKSL